MQCNNPVTKYFIIASLLILIGSVFPNDACPIALRINEIYYDPPVVSAEEHNAEFVELYVVEGGDDPSYWYVTDWDENNYWEIPPECPEVSTGDFIVIHIGSGINDIDGPVYHFYMGRSDSQLSNIGDPLTLHKDNDFNHDRATDPPLDFVTYEGGADSELGDCNAWCGWPNDGINPTDFGPVAPDNLGKSVQIFGDDLDCGSNWAAGPPTEGRDNSLIGEIHWCESIGEVRAQPDGILVGVTATVHAPIGVLNDERRQFWLQDETSGIVIDNTPERTTRSYQLGDVLAVTGTLATRYAERQIVLESDPGLPHGSAELEVPVDLSVAEYRESVVNGDDEYQGRLIRLKNVRFDNLHWEDWREDTSYRIRQAGSSEDAPTVYIRIEDGCELSGELVPKGIPMTVTGFASRFYDYPRILPRYPEDLEFEEISGVESARWENYP